MDDGFLSIAERFGRRRRRIYLHTHTAAVTNLWAVRAGAGAGQVGAGQMSIGLFC